MKSKIDLIIRREYLERVSKKSFIITTILMPLLMVFLMVLPALIMVMGGGTGESKILVIDKSESVFQEMHEFDDVKFFPCTESLDSATARTDFDAVLVIPANVLTSDKAQLKLYSNGPSSMMRESAITGQINNIVKDKRLLSYNIENIDKIIADAEVNLPLTTIRTDKTDDENLGSGISYGLGVAMSFILYMFILIYGQMIMTSIIEEKNNRVLELVVSSVKPAQLMMGKILGVSLVALTQILLWGVLIVALVGFVMPAVLPSLLPADAMSDIAAVKAGNIAAVSDQDTVDLIQGVLLLSNVGFILKLLATMTAFLIAGFLFYAAIFAAIGSSVDNVQDAGQLTTVVTFPIIFAIIFAMLAAGDPTSGLAFWTSIIPFTSPMVMVARVPYGIPGWEVWLSLGLLIASFIGMVWVAGKIYRVGIFMYGKKPSIREIIRWFNYK
ncbi:MAG: ABC transporter permease [Duncaniella sp.]|nr:ABC transporter permease [Duncaniella sp.]